MKANLFIPENETEEALMLMGRVEAFAAYVKEQHSDIERRVAAAMLGFELEEGEKMG